MAQSRVSMDDAEAGAVYEAYILDVRIVEAPHGDESGPRYRFEAPDHVGFTFDDPEMATLYADVYFDVNGFEEASTGERGVPPEIVQAGQDTLASYFLTQPYADRAWVSSFFGVTPEKVERYADWVRERADEIRSRAIEENIA